jgi:hypothetical protein
MAIVNFIYSVSLSLPLTCPTKRTARYCFLHEHDLPERSDSMVVSVLIGQLHGGQSRCCNYLMRGLATSLLPRHSASRSFRSFPYFTQETY